MKSPVRFSEIVLSMAVTFFIMGNAFAEVPTNTELFESAKAKGKLVADYWLTKNVVSTYYADGCSFYGCCLFGEATADTSYYNSIFTRYKQNKPSKIPTASIDENSCGILPLHLFLRSNDSSLLSLGKTAADYNISQHGWVRNAIDDTYMTGSLLIQAYKATGDTAYLNFCANYILQYMNHLQQSNGLYHHRDGGPHFWGRGNGWGAASVTELLQILPEVHPLRDSILDRFKKQMTGLVATQKASGVWMQLLTSTNTSNWEETSGTAMFLFAMFTGIKNGWLDEATFLEPAKKGWAGLLTYLPSDGKLKNIATGMWGGANESDYLNVSHNETGNAHGTCGFLWAATAAVKLFTPTASGYQPFSSEKRPAIARVRTSGNRRLFDLMGRTVAITINEGDDANAIHPVHHTTGTLSNGIYFMNDPAGTVQKTVPLIGR